MEQEERKGSAAAYSRVAQVEELLPSCDGESQIRMKLWDPVDVEPRGIIQLVHGMAEHIGRYEDFAQFLAQRGFVVVGHDHIGHGLSVEDETGLGVLPLNGGKDILAGDVQNVRLAVQSCYEPVPYFLFGHSMGSFVVRYYLSKYGFGLAGAIICGTGDNPLSASFFGLSAANAVALTEGVEHKSPVLETLIMGSFELPFLGEGSKNSWISSDPSVVAKYDADPFSGFSFSAGGFATLSDLSAEVSTTRNASLAPKNVPLLFIAGQKDPVGLFGKGVAKAAKRYINQGVEDVEVRIYPGMRHEVLNEPGNYRVYNDVVSWIKDHE